MSSDIDRIIDLAFDTYEQIKRKENPKYKAKHSSHNRARIRNAFLYNTPKSLFLASIGRRWMLRFVNYQFNFCRSIQRQINIHETFSKQAFERFFDRPKETDQNPPAEVNTQFELLEDKQRAVHFNTGEGFLYCIDFTSLYDGRSPYCVVCRFKKECKKIKHERAISDRIT